MGLVSTIIGFSGFGVGSCIGVTIGYFLFVYFQPTDVKDPAVRPLTEHDSDSILKLLPEIPLWVKNPDFDRVDWLNRFVDHMWPYLDTAICKKVETIVKPLIDEQIPKYKIQSVDFETLSLGTLPPTFQGMKVFVTEEKELIMEVAMKWAGNPNILVAAKAFGMKATVQVVDLQVFAHPRITLKPLVPAFPCFANICVSLMEKPHVDFGLKLLGADAMSIPGLYRFVQELIQDRVATMYLWPRALEVPILDSHNAMKRPVGILKVKIVRAKKLRNKELIGRSDPFVRMKLSEDLVSRKKTTVKHNNLNPEWNEEFNMTVKDPQTQALEVIVYDHEQFGNHDKMGMNVVPLSQLTPEETKSVTLDLLRSMDPNDARNGKARGHLEVELTYKPFRENEMGMDIENSDEVEKAPDGTPSGGGLLVVMIHHAEDVEGKHHTNPFARVVFKGEEKKTKHIKKNRDPRWEEEFSFMLEEPPINDKLYVEVQSVSSRIGILHPKENLGYVEISLADVVSNKRINQTFSLIESRNGKIQIELQWREAA